MAEQVKVDLPTIFAVKSGMTRIFNENGDHVPVTVLKLITNKISQVKTSEKEGYSAYQVAYSPKREKLVNSPDKGQLKKAGIEEFLTSFSEVRVADANPESLGQEVGLGELTADTVVDVTGVSKGKGFQGVIKRYNFAGGPQTHGSKFHRTTGSIGNRATPGKVFKNKKMPGHMGAKKKTIQNIKIVEINEEKGYMLVKGSVPGAKSSIVRVSRSVKSAQ